MREFSFYDPATGLFIGRTFACDEADPVRRQKALEAHTPAGSKAIEGRHDHLSRRVNLETRAVEDYQPPQPSADHEWNPDAKRWQLRADVAERQARRAAALAEIARLEASQARPIREAALGMAGAIERVRAIDARIAELREDRSEARPPSPEKTRS